MHPVFAFTLVELFIVIVIIAVAAVWVASLFGGAKDKLEETEKVTYTSGWVNPPATISPAPASGTFTYQVKQQKGTQVPQPAPDRTVLFTLKLSAPGTGLLVSVGQSGSPFNIPSTNPPTLEFAGLTDTYGIILVVVQLEEGQTASLIASDTKSGLADPPISFTAK